MGAVRSDYMTPLTHSNEALPSSYEQGINCPNFQNGFFFKKWLGIAP